LISGTHTVRAARRGHDPIEQTLEVAAGESVDVSLDLIPNARTVILRTEPEDVEVWLDGQLVGRTSRVEEFIGLGRMPAQLVIEDVPLGEHTFEFRAECRRAQKIVDALNVDLLDRAPKRYDTVRLAESFVLLTPVGGPDGTELRVDGQRIATLPAESLQACPGERDIQAVYANRVLWSERLTLVEGVPRTLEIRARPNLVLVGLDRLPRELERWAASVNVMSMEASSGADFSRTETWRTWIAIRIWRWRPTPTRGKARRRAGGCTARCCVRSTVSQTCPTRPNRPGAPPRGASRWSMPANRWSSSGSSSPLGCPRWAVASRWLPEPPSRVSPRRRLVSPRRRTAEQSTSNGRNRTERAPPAASPRPVVTAESGAPSAPAALANLALVFGAHGEHELAVRTWQRVDWPERVGVGAGTVAYYLGRELQALGRDREAIEALRRAAASSGRAGTATGPPVAPAARDRLADLGQK